MKHFFKLHRHAKPIVILVAGLISFANAIGQTAGNQPSGLYAEHDESHNRIAFPIGRTMLFKTKAQNMFQKGKLVGFTDSTLTFALRKQTRASYRFNEIAKLKTSKTPGRMVAKTALILTGVALIVVDFGNSLAGGDTGGTMSGFGLVAIAGGLAVSGRTSVDLSKHWSLKTVALSSMDSAMLKSSTSPSEVPANGKFILGLGLGYGGQVDQSTPSAGFVIYAEPRYMFSKSLGAGLHIEYVDESASIISCSLTGRYYLGAGNVRPFLGAGVGFYSVKLPSSSSASGVPSSFQTFGFYPRVGVEFKRVNLIVDYNKLPDQTGTVDYYFPGNPGFWAAIPTSKEYSYLTVTLGIGLGGGR